MHSRYQSDTAEDQVESEVLYGRIRFGKQYRMVKKGGEQNSDSFSVWQYEASP